MKLNLINNTKKQNDKLYPFDHIVNNSEVRVVDLAKWDLSWWGLFWKKVFKYAIRRYLDLNTFFFISNNISTPMRLFCKTMRTSTLFLFYYGNKIYSLSFSSSEERNWSICDVILIQTCRESCSLLHLRDFKNSDDWFSFWKEIGFILLIWGASLCSIY